MRGLEMSYWDSVLSGLISRRRALAATVSAGLGTLLLAACGRGGGSGVGTSGSQSSLLTRVEDTSAKAVPGGTWRTTDVADANGFDVHKIATIPAGRATDFYTFLLKYSRGIQGRMGPIVGDSAESFE